MCGNKVITPASAINASVVASTRACNLAPPELASEFPKALLLIFSDRRGCSCVYIAYILDVYHRQILPLYTKLFLWMPVACHRNCTVGNIDHETAFVVLIDVYRLFFVDVGPISNCPNVDEGRYRHQHPITLVAAFVPFSVDN